jgi:hypothetical protein
MSLILRAIRILKDVDINLYLKQASSNGNCQVVKCFLVPSDSNTYLMRFHGGKKIKRSLLIFIYVQNETVSMGFALNTNSLKK